MPANSVSGKGLGASHKPTYVNQDNAIVTKLTIAGTDYNDRSVLTTNNGQLLVNGIPISNNIQVLGTFMSNDSPATMRVIDFNDFFEWEGAGLFFVPTTSDYKDWFCRSGGCDCSCEYCSTYCGCNIVYPYQLLCVNPQLMNNLDMRYHYRKLEIDFSSLINIQNLEVRNLRNTNLDISGFASLSDMYLSHAIITEICNFSNLPVLEDLHLDESTFDESQFTVDFETIPLLEDIDINTCNLSAAFVDQLFIDLAASLDTYPRINGWVNCDNNNGVTATSLAARNILTTAGWNLSYS